MYRPPLHQLGHRWQPHGTQAANPTQPRHPWQTQWINHGTLSCTHQTGSQNCSQGSALNCNHQLVSEWKPLHHLCVKEIPSNHLHLSSSTWLPLPLRAPDSQSFSLLKNIANICLFAFLSISASKPSFLLTPGNHWLTFFCEFSASGLLQASDFEFNQGTSGYNIFPMTQSYIHSHLFMSAIQALGEMPNFFQNSLDFCLSVQPSSKES